jgi:hypothetical protein
MRGAIALFGSQKLLPPPGPRLGTGSGLRSSFLGACKSEASVYPEEAVDLLAIEYLQPQGYRLMTKLGPFSSEEQPAPLKGMEGVPECAWKPAARVPIAAERRLWHEGLSCFG